MGFHVPLKYFLYYDQFHTTYYVIASLQLWRFIYRKKKMHRHCAKQSMRVKIQSIAKKKFDFNDSHSFLCKIQNIWNKLHTHTSQWITFNFVLSEHWMEKLTFLSYFKHEIPEHQAHPGPGILTFLIAWNSTILFTLNRYYNVDEKVNSGTFPLMAWFYMYRKQYKVCWTLLSFYVQFTCLFFFNHII